MYPFFGKVLREICTEKRSRKMPSMCPKCPEVPGHRSASAISGLAHTPKNAGTCPVRCLVYRSIVKRYAMTGSWLGRYVESRPAPGSRAGIHLPENRGSFSRSASQSPALKGYRLSSIQTAQYWPVYLLSKCPVSLSGVKMRFPEKNRPGNHRNWPVGCRK